MIKKVSDPEKRKFTTSETVLLVIMSLVIGLAFGALLNKTNIITKKAVISDKNLYELVENYEYILNNYYKELDERELVNSAINGMMESLEDPYSVYFDKNETENFAITLDGSYKGIGVQIIKNEETKNILVTAVFKNSPAYIAGLKAGDEIVKIDGKSTHDYEVDEFSKSIKESQKESFVFEVLRDDEIISLTIKKSVVTLDSVSSEIFEENDKKVGYIYIGIFANNTYNQFKTELENLEKENINYLIIDVRGNTGGHLTSVHSMLDLFLNKKQIMYQFEQNGDVTTTHGTGNENKKYEIVLLGDEASASASEMLIASLKENLGSTFVGKKTYGKGTVQELVTLSDGTQYKITVKKWLTPNGNWINDTEGISPDIEVELDNKYYETYDALDDTQLQKALQYIKEK